MANATLPENEAPEQQGQSGSSGGKSPYDSQTRGGNQNQRLTPGSAPITARPSGPSQRLSLPRNSSSTSKPSPKDAAAMSGGSSSPSRYGRPNYNTGEPSSRLSPQSDSTRPQPESTSRPADTEPEESDATNDQENEASAEPDENNSAVDLDTDTDPYDRPGNAPDNEKRPQDLNPAANRPQVKSAPSRTELANDEKSGGAAATDKAAVTETQKLGRGYTGDTKDIGKRGESIYRRLLKTKARKAALGLPIGGGLVAIIFILFISLAPLKILHIVTNLEDRFFANSNHALDKESEKLFEGYVRKRLIVLGTCKNVIDIECNATNSLNPVTRLWKGWAHRRIEEKMANKYGFHLIAEGGKYYVKLPGMQGNGADVTEKFVTGDVSLDQAIAESAEGQRIKVSRNQVRTLVRTSLKDANLYDKTVFKYKYLQLLAEKYGVRLCLFWCTGKDAFATSVADQSRAGVLALTERLDRQSMIRVLTNCLFNITGSCANVDNPKFVPCEDGVNCEAGGRAVTDLELELESELRASAASYGLGGDEVKKLDKNLTAAEKAPDSAGLDGIEQKEAADLEAELTGKDASGYFKGTLSKLAWVLMIAQIIDTANKAGPVAKKVAYAANIALAVKLFNTYSTASHECKSGHCNARELGSLSSTLDYNQNAKKGGPASAEESPAYNKYINGSSKPSGNTNDIKCDGGKALLPSGICPEEYFAGGIAMLNSLHDILNAPGFKIITEIAGKIVGLFNYILNVIFSLVGGLLGSIFHGLEAVVNATCVAHIGGIYVGPFAPYCEIRDLIDKAIPYVTKTIVHALLPSPFSLFMGGGRTFDMMAAGAAASGYDTAQAMGGVEAPPGATASIYQEQQQLAMQEYQSQPLLKRLTDTQSDFSPATKLAMAMPSNATDVSYGMMSFFSNPFGSLSHSFGSLFSKHALAETSVADGSEFGITPYFVPDEAIDEVGTHQDEFWTQNCADNKIVANGQMSQRYAGYAAAWYQQHKDDPNSTGLAVNPYLQGDAKNYYGTNPCAFISYAICPNSTFNDDMVCSTDDQNGNQNQTTTFTSGSSPGGSSSTANTPAPITGDCKDGGQYAAIVGKGASFQGHDQGIDFTPPAAGGFSICAPASGTIVQADTSGHDWQNTSGEVLVVLKLDKKPTNANSGGYVYFGELIQIAAGIAVGGHVNKGDVIGFNNQSPGIEVGWASGSGGPGSGFEPVCGLHDGTACGHSFDDWVKAGGG